MSNKNISQPSVENMIEHFNKTPIEIMGSYKEPFTPLPVTPENIIAEGWEDMNLKNPFGGEGVIFRHGFEKGNFVLILDTRKPHIEIIARDNLLLRWLPEFPEIFRVVLPIDNMDSLRTIFKLLDI